MLARCEIGAQDDRRRFESPIWHGSPPANLTFTTFELKINRPEAVKHSKREVIHVSPKQNLLISKAPREFYGPYICTYTLSWTLTLPKWVVASTLYGRIHDEPR